MSFGLTSTGFIPKSIEVERDEMNDRLKARFGESLDLSDGALLGDMVAIFAERLGLLWELGEAVNASQDPNAATGARLDALCALTGTSRHPATYSTAVLTLAGNPATAIPSGSKVSTASTAVQFSTVAGVTLGSLTSWVATTAYAIGARRTNSSRAYEAIVAGTSAASGGPNTTAPSIVDGTVTWKYIGEGSAVADVSATPSNSGPVVAVAYDVANIDTPVAGWLSALNLNDASQGAPLETDEQLRARREDELFAAGASTADAIRASLLEINTVTEAHVFHNTSDVTDVDGVPAHGVEAVVRTVPVSVTADTAIRKVLFNEVAAGNPTYGSVIGTVTDSEGVAQTIKFSRPTELNIYVIVNVIVNQPSNANNSPKFPVDGANQIKLAIVNGFTGELTGRDVVASLVGSKSFSVPGVLDVTTTLISAAPTVVPVASTTIPISLRQLAAYDTSRITVNVTNGTP
jgi:uncharacterized phage protein gp47/JayE